MYTTMAHYIQEIYSSFRQKGTTSMKTVYLSNYIQRRNLETLFFVVELSLVLGILFLQSPLRAEDSNIELHWPLEKNLGLSATFGEYRSGHFHSGIDLKTGGNTGLKVFAAESGTIYRLSIKKRGYGKALYIRHKDDYITVYGHLERFEENTLFLESRVMQQQLESGKYPGNIYLSVPVKKGQLIGYSGETGAGLPHLHFELRQGENNPINPLTHGITCQDSTKPYIRSISLVPVTAGSWIDLQQDAMTITRKQLNTREKNKNPLQIRGVFEIFVDAYDQVRALNKVGIYSLSLMCDSSEKAKQIFENCSYSNNHRVGLTYKLDETGFSPTTYQYTTGHRYRDENPFDLNTQWRQGMINCDTIAAENHKLTITITDASGNRDSVDLEFESFRDVAGTTPQSQQQPTATANTLHSLKLIDRGEILSVEGSYTPVSSGKPVITFTIDQSDQSFMGNLVSLRPGEFRGALDLREFTDEKLTFQVFSIPESRTWEEKTYQVRKLYRNRKARVNFENVALTLEEDYLYEDVYLTIERIVPAHYGELVFLDHAVSLRPAAVPLEKAGKLEFRINESSLCTQSQIGIYGRNGQTGKWYYRSSMTERDNNGTFIVSSSLASFGSFGIFADKTPPSLTIEKRNGKFQYTVGSKIYILASDKGTGINDETLIVTLNGKDMEAEYDPDRSRITVFLPIGLKPGRFSLIVRCSDYAQNSSKVFENNIHIH